MDFSRARLTSALVLVVGSAGCAKLRTSGAAPPALMCTNLVSAGADGSSLTAALASASAGTCILLGATTYRGNFVVPAGVAIASPTGAPHGTLSGTADGQPAVSLTGGVGSGLSDLDVVVSAGIGIAIHGGPVVINDVNVEDAASAAIAASAPTSSTDDAGTAHTVPPVTLTNVNLTKSEMGLWASGIPVIWSGGECSMHTSAGALTGGDGIVITNAASLDLTAVTVEGNGGLGILFDGAGTTGALHQATITSNGDRGVWAQHLVGTDAAPSLTLDGTSITENHLVGLGLVASSGVAVSGGNIDRTILSPIATDLGTTEVGDGVGVFAGTSIVRLAGVSFDANGRAAGLVDDPGAGIEVQSVTDSGGQFQFVVQDATMSVAIPASLVSTPPNPLAFSAAVISIPPP